MKIVFQQRTQRFVVVQRVLLSRPYGKIGRTMNHVNVVIKQLKNKIAF